MRRAIIAALLLLAFAALPAQAAANGADGTSAPGWGGYRTRSVGGPYDGVNITECGATWRVPNIAYGAGGPLSGETLLIWVGIDTGTNIVQLGTAEWFPDTTGALSTESWYERYPLESIQPLSGMYNIKPGDLITASITCTANCAKGATGTTWHWAMSNATQNWSWTSDALNYDMGSFDHHCEVVIETQTGQRIARFGDIPFVSITVNGAALQWQSPDTALLYLHDVDGDTANPSLANATSDGFKLCWGNGSNYTACPNTPSLNFDHGHGGF